MEWKWVATYRLTASLRDRVSERVDWPVWTWNTWAQHQWSFQLATCTWHTWSWCIGQPCPVTVPHPANARLHEYHQHAAHTHTVYRYTCTCTMHILSHFLSTKCQHINNTHPITSLMITWTWNVQLQFFHSSNIFTCIQTCVLASCHFFKLIPYNCWALKNSSIVFTAQCTLVQMRSLGIACRLSVRLSVCLTLVICDHIGWKSWKLIARTTSPTPSLFVARRRSTYSQGNMGKFWGD